MADKWVVTRRRRGRCREYGRHNLIHICFQLQGDEKRTSKTDKNRQMLVTMGSTNRKSEVSFSKV